jgi:hypothetical protein
MTRKLPKRGLPLMHPGELLREEILPALDRPKTEIAKLLGASRQMLYDIIGAKPPAVTYQKTSRTLTPIAQNFIDCARAVVTDGKREPIRNTVLAAPVASR